ncbi:hypothetical protein BTVI_79131 [Pitangus sulphuratus]|nr:hypothetical protein BTVI_79131 [Pitangus sulphuratus]
MCWRRAPCKDKDIVAGESFAFQTLAAADLLSPELNFVSFQQPGTVDSMEQEAGSLARGLVPGKEQVAPGGTIPAGQAAPQVELWHLHVPAAQVCAEQMKD